MKAIFSSTALIVGLISSAGVYAAAPAGATGLCKDGSYNTSANKQGACRGHKGIQEWYAETGTTAAVIPTTAPAQMTKITKTTSSTADLTSSTSSTGATGLCKDGTYYTGANKQGACRGHKGIQTWYANAATTAATTVTTTAPTMTQTKVTKSTTTPSATPAGTAPAGSTGLCNDGSYYAGANKQGACRGHKGIKDWYGSAASGAATVGTTAAVTTPAAPPTSVPEKKGMFSFLNKKPATSPTTATTTTTTSTTATTTSQAAPKAVAAGGGVGQVWVNSDSNVYHCQSSQWYGKTKTGSYMTEAAAKAAGARPDHGKACS